MKNTEKKSENDEVERLEEEMTTDLPEGLQEIDGLDEGELNVEKDSKISLQKNDRSLAEFARWNKNGRMIVDPEWQRKYVWDKNRASRLIESFLIDLPIPVIYLALNEEDKYEVIDGLQRLTSVFKFFQGDFALQGLELKTDLNGRYFRDLDEKIQSKLEDTTLRTFELSNKTPKDLMFLIFNRLNTGGVKLNDMEIRNCLFRGKLNDLIKELARNENFRQAVSQKGLDKRMTDRALVLRFVAFLTLNYNSARKGMKNFLNEFCAQYRDPVDSKISEWKKDFDKAARAAFTIFGSQSFRLRRDSARGGGEWASRVNATVFQVLMTSFVKYDLGHLTRSADNIYEAYLDLIQTDTVWRDSVSSSTGDFSKIEYSFKTWEDRLKSAMRDSEPNDKQRCFSRKLKEEMFHSDSTCQICAQRIAAISDAALDHDKMYWQGGKTIPDNARLVHRHCNSSRAKT